MVTLATLFALVLMATAFENPNLGLWICIAVGFGADPLRKLTPGEPVVFVVLVVLFVGTTFMGYLRQKRSMKLPSFLSRDKSVRGSLRTFAVIVGIGVALAVLKTRSPMVAGIGTLAYLAPVPAVLVAYHFARSERQISRFFWAYAALAAIMASGIFFSAMGSDNILLKAVGDEQFVYPVGGGDAVRLLCGFFRSSENAAWHCSTAASLLLLMAASKRRIAASDWFAGILVIYFTIAIFLTGRRKGLATIMLFLVLFGFLLARFRRGAQRLAVLALLFGLVGAYVVRTRFLSDHTASRYQVYFDRGATTTGGSAVDRLRNNTVESFQWVIAANGFFGAGAGLGSQGSQHFGGGSDVVGSAAEGGLGKVLGELGVPGLAVLCWIGIAFARRLWKLAGEINFGDPNRARLSFGLMALLFANAVEFATAHQIFGDPFVLLMLGWMFGFILALIRMNESALAKAGSAGPSAARLKRPAPKLSPAPAEPITGIVGFDGA